MMWGAEGFLVVQGDYLFDLPYLEIFIYIAIYLFITCFDRPQMAKQWAISGL